MRFFSKISKSKNTLRLFQKTQKLINFLKEDLNGLDWQQNKFNIDVVERICNLIETEFVKEKKIDSKIDKKDVLFKIIESFLPSLSPEDKRIIGEIVEHLHNTGRIKGVSTKRVLFAISKVFLGSSKKD
jgi:hypothetical protein